MTTGNTHVERLATAATAPGENYARPDVQYTLLGYRTEENPQPELTRAEGVSMAVGLLISNAELTPR